jgi:hypothetical protein
MVVRTAQQQRSERLSKFVPHLASAIAPSLVVQAFDAVPHIAVTRSRHVRAGDLEKAGDLRDQPACAQHRNNLKTLCRGGVSGFATFPDQPAPLRACNSSYL